MINLAFSPVGARIRGTPEKLAETTKNTLIPTPHHHNELLMSAPPVSTRDLHRSGISEMHADLLYYDLALFILQYLFVAP